MIRVAQLFQVIAVLLAWHLGRRRASYRPVARFLGAMTIAQWARVVLVQRFDLLLPGPHAGLKRLAFHVQDALFLAWPAGVALLCAAVFLRWRGRRLALVAAPWIALEAVVVAVYPAIRGNLLVQWVHGGAQLGAFLFGGAAIAAWLMKSIRPETAKGAALLIWTFSGVVLLGPYLGAVQEHWNLAAGVYGIMYLLLVIVMGGTVWTSSSPPPSDAQGSLH